jgi:hypothetical protein
MAEDARGVEGFINTLQSIRRAELDYLGVSLATKRTSLFPFPSGFIVSHDHRLLIHAFAIFSGGLRERYNFGAGTVFNADLVVLLRRAEWLFAADESMAMVSKFTVLGTEVSSVASTSEIFSTVSYTVSNTLCSRAT